MAKKVSKMPMDLIFTATLLSYRADRDENEAQTCNRRQICCFQLKQQSVRAAARELNVCTSILLLVKQQEFCFALSFWTNKELNKVPNKVASEHQSGILMFHSLETLVQVKL